MYRNLYHDQLAYARDEGRAEGKVEARAEFAQRMLQHGAPQELLTKYTGYTKDQLDALQTQ